MEISKFIANDMSYHNEVDRSSRYSGPEPQTLPLPPELVMRTLRYLDRVRDKKNARLVCKGFAAAGLYSLTSTVCFSNSLIWIWRTFDNVPHFSCSTRDIAMHPVVSKYIIKMVCEGSRIPSSYLAYRTSFDWWATVGKHGKPRSTQEIYSVYSSSDDQEKFTIGKGADREVVRTALENFVNLKCIVFTDIAPNERSRDFPRPPWPADAPVGDPWGPSSPYHSFAVCIRLLSDMRIKLRELSIEGSQDGISHSVFSRISTQDSCHLLNVFANLRKLSVNVNTHFDTWLLDFAGLGRFLTQATLLQSLDLKCSRGERQTRLSLSQVFKTATWPYLKHFGLHGFVMSTNMDLIAFFDRHRATIDSVAFKSIFLHEKDFNSRDHSPCEAWKHLFTELRKRSIKFQNLELFRIHDCCNWGGECPDLADRADRGEKILQYLRHGGPNPLTVETVSEVNETSETDEAIDVSDTSEASESE